MTEEGKEESIKMRAIVRYFLAKVDFGLNLLIGHGIGPGIGPNKSKPHSSVATAHSWRESKEIAGDEHT